jgi:MHS family proline/betaine transporter-like MFS transporter
MSYTVFGGTAPLMATWLISATGSNLTPAFYLMTISLLAMAGGLTLPETYRKSLSDEICDGRIDSAPVKPALT